MFDLRELKKDLVWKNLAFITMRVFEAKRGMLFYMNEVFIIGKIISDIDFKFIINSKTKKSIARFTIKTKTNQEICIRAYNDLADFVYSRFKQNNNVFIFGRLCGNYVIINNAKII